MRNELLSWFAREGLLLQSATTSSQEDEIKITLRGPIIALSRAHTDFRECPDPVLFGYPEDSLDWMNVDDLNHFVLQWFEQAVAAGQGRCFVCNKLLVPNPDSSPASGPANAKPWDAVFVTKEWYCWMLVHFDCKRYLNRDLKGRNPFEVVLQPPEFFNLRVS